ncbi:MAG: phosphomannomutase/phosphoglucomutase [Clostridia bacterium]|nr:phosphomannomutase/phosphoglucomutase [Clostridia bacterium]
MILKLKSGTDVRGTAVDGAGKPMELDDETVGRIVKSYIAFLAKKCGRDELTVALGHDSRVSSPRMYAACEKAALDSGVSLLKCGLTSTPSLFMILKSDRYSCDGSIMITASHLPADKNGLKFFTGEGGLEGDDIEYILEGALYGREIAGEGKAKDVNFLDEYSENLVSLVRTACGRDKPLTGRKIVVDASSGVGGFYTEKVLKPLGADTTGSVNLEPDGTFPAHVPNPENEDAIKSLQSAVLKAGADFGIIFDTDVDRAACVDRDGTEINRNRLIALISAMLLKEKPGTIVTDSVASDHLTEFIESLGGKHLRYKRGYKNVIDKCVALNREGTYSPLAIETSGHAALKDNYYLDDGAYLVTRLLIALASGNELSDLIKDLRTPAEEAEVRITFTEESTDFKEEGLQVIDELKLIAEECDGVTAERHNFEGLRLRFDEDNGNGWIQIRQSVHDPVIPVNFESDTPGGIKEMAKTLLLLIGGYDFLNCETLAALAGVEYDPDGDGEDIDIE